MVRLALGGVSNASAEQPSHTPVRQTQPGHHISPGRGRPQMRRSALDGCQGHRSRICGAFCAPTGTSQTDERRSQLRR